ncbi:unnamed protein product [Gulo gulo]|uniref:Uncharacterized protein n=1 Tax=Gulo gulo TaxID=48420 RepID=A0A9X9M0S0_GULGU|nr:unnamed protein product [Gulo gulo]
MSPINSDPSVGGPPVSGRGCRQKRMTTGTLNERESVLGQLWWPQGRTYHLHKNNSPRPREEGSVSRELTFFPVLECCGSVTVRTRNL